MLRLAPTLSAAALVLAALPATAVAVPAPPDRAPAAADRQGATTIDLSVSDEVSDQVGPQATVVVAGTDGAVPAGRVVVRSGRRVLATSATSGGSTVRVRLELRPLRAGQHRVTAEFRASGRPVGRSTPVLVTSQRGCAWKPHACGLASAATTGVPAGARLTPSGSVTVDEPGTVIEGLDIEGSLTIRASDVTVRNTRVHGSDFQLVKIEDGATGVRIRRVEVDGEGAGPGSSGIVGGSPTIVRTRVTGVENGFVPGSGTRIRRSYVHGLAAPGAPHFDGIQIDGGLHDIVVSGNTVDVSDHTQTSAVMVDNYFGPIADVTITGNLLIGGGYTVYADGSFSSTDDIADVTYSGNRMVRGYYGYALVRNADVTWSGNVVDRTGSTLRMRR
jgi:hypothetical protein